MYDLQASPKTLHLTIDAPVIFYSCLCASVRASLLYNVYFDYFFETIVQLPYTYSRYANESTIQQKYVALAWFSYSTTTHVLSVLLQGFLFLYSMGYVLLVAPLNFCATIIQVYMYMYSTHKKLPMNSPFNGPPIPILHLPFHSPCKIPLFSLPFACSHSHSNPFLKFTVHGKCSRSSCVD